MRRIEGKDNGAGSHFGGILLILSALREGEPNNTCLFLILGDIGGGEARALG